MKRAIRRHHRRRLINKRKSYFGGYMNNPKQFGKVARTATPCSCHMCGNARRHWGYRTMQELRFECGLISEDM